MTTTLAHHYYHQPEVFGYECEHIFKRHWWLVTTEAAFAENGDYQTFKPAAYTHLMLPTHYPA